GGRGRVGGDGEVGGAVGVAGRGGVACAGVGVPDPHRVTIVTPVAQVEACGGGGEPGAVGGDRQAGDAVGVAGQGCAAFAGVGVPEPECGSSGPAGGPGGGCGGGGAEGRSAALGRA